MAEIVTGTTTGYVNMDRTGDQISDVRREAAEHSLIGVGATKDARFDVASRIGEASRQTTSELFAIGRESADNKAQITALSFQVRDGFFAAGKDAEIASLKTQVTVFNDGEKTRDLIAMINNQNLQTALINQNSQLVAGGLAYQGLGLAYGGVNAAYQSANTTNAINAFQSQIASQGVVNTGTMTGAAGQQTNTPTSIR